MTPSMSLQTGLRGLASSSQLIGRSDKSSNLKVGRLLTEGPGLGKVREMRFSS